MSPRLNKKSTLGAISKESLRKLRGQYRSNKNKFTLQSFTPRNSKQAYVKFPYSKNPTLVTRAKKNELIKKDNKLSNSKFLIVPTNISRFLKMKNATWKKRYQEMTR